MSRPWMPLYVADYQADTAHLSTTEHGAYLLLIMFYWTKGKLPDDEEAIRRVTRMSPRQWSQSRDVLRSLFGDDWHHKRIDAELSKAIEKSQVNSANAKRRHSERTANAQRSDTHARASSQPQSQSHLKKDTPLRVVDDWPDDHGDVFWQAYPRKTEKLAAMKKLAAIRKSGIVTFADLMAGVKRYAATGTDPQYTKHPTTWLNAGCWADETQPGGSNGNRNHTAARGSASADFFAGMRSVAADIVGDDPAPGPAAAEIPLGRVNIDG